VVESPGPTAGSIARTMAGASLSWPAEAKGSEEVVLRIPMPVSQRSLMD
jgi:hypothetical protein